VLSDEPAVVAARLAASPIKEQLVAALDNWACLAFVLRQHDRAEQLMGLARSTAPDPAWGDRLRQSRVWRDPPELGKLAAQAPAVGLSPQLLDLVGFLLERAKSPRTETWLRQAQAEHPADFWLNFDLAVALGKTSPAEAAGFFRVAIAVRPATSAAYNNLGVVLAAQKKREEAIAAYHRAIDLQPKNVRAHTNLGVALAVQGQPDEAIAAFRKAIAIAPNYAPAYYKLGLALKAQRKPDEAIAAYRKAIEHDAKHARAYFNLGVALREQNQLPEAVAAYRKTIALDATDADAHCNLGVLLKHLGQLDEAIASYRKAIEHNPKHALAYSNLGIALREQHKLPEAIASYRKAIELDPKRATAHQQLALVLATCPDPKVRDPRLAVEHAKKGVELQPQGVVAWQVLGWAQYRAGAWRESIAALEKSCTLENGGDSGQWVVLALAHAKLATQEDLPEEEREHHKAEARRRYEQADKRIDSLWPVRPRDSMGQAIWDFRAEARALLGAEDGQK
jgi:tetratricopeptide (TPR) repeat protein